jgi:hypothetical protein
MATTITNYSVELAQNSPVTVNTYAPLRPTEFMGRIRISSFTYTFASDASGVSNALCVIPSGARILDVVIKLSATMGGTCTLAFGLAGRDASGYIDDGGSTIVSGGTQTGADTGIGSSGTEEGAVGTSTIADSTTYVGAAIAQTATTRQSVLQGSAFMFLCPKDEYLTVTVGAASAGTQVLQGYVMWVLD